jgi:alditol oxidase
MKRRKFLQASGLIATGAIAGQWIACKESPKNLPATAIKNWAENLQYSTTNVFYPSTVDEVIKLVKEKEQLKVLGSRHSFNTIADSKSNLVSTKELKKIVQIDKATNTVTVEAGVTYGDLAPYLHQNGYALHNLASLPHISVGGATATATHGSGVKNGNLSTAVVGVEIINAAGDLISLSKEKNPAEFYGAVVHLGALGVVSRLTLALQPSFPMKQVVYRNLPMKELEKNFVEIMSAGYSVSLFTDWTNKNISEVWVKKIPSDPASPQEYFGAKLSNKNLHPIESLSAENCTDQLDSSGVWYERMPHFKMGFKPSAGKELQSEFFIPIDKAVEAMAAMETLHNKITPHLFISEIRSIKGDDFWMSPCYQQDSVAIHTTWKQDPEVEAELIPMVEEVLAPFNPRPHWAKLFTISPEKIQKSYAKLPDFKKLINSFDPNGKFRNDFLEHNLFSTKTKG